MTVNITSPVIVGSTTASVETTATVEDYVLASSPTVVTSTVHTPLTAASVPVPLNTWPIRRQAHIMSALSAANPKYGLGDYTIESADIGRLHVWVDNTDLTYLRNVPSQFADFTRAVPAGPTSASIGLPQMKPWDEPGTGDLAALDMARDPEVQIALIRTDDSVEVLWEGYLAADEDSSGPGREDYTFHAEGLFTQAMHEPWDPPVFMDETDIGTVIADALNAVTHRRWNAIPRVSTGITTRNRGQAGQSVWQYVQDLLSTAWTSDARQWTLTRVGPFNYALALKATTATADWTVTKGAPGVDVRLVRDQAVRRDAIYGRGFNPDGGFWCGRVFPGLEFGVPPRYPFDNTSTTLTTGAADASTDTGDGVTTWQRKMRDVGYPVTVDGVMNSADATWVRKIQTDRGLLVDGILGPQTWAATWENNSTDGDFTSYRLPLATRTEVEPWLYSATGAHIGKNPDDDPRIVRHAMPEVDFGSGIKKSDAITLAERMLARDEDPGYSGTIVLTTDPHESGASRFDIKPGDNVEVVGHRGDIVTQVSEVSVNDLQVTLTVDTRARDALSVAAILERDQDARRDPSSRFGSTTDGSSLNKASVVQYESESRAGYVPRTAINGDVGLWTIRKTFVSQVGVAKVEFTIDSPKAELVVALFNRPIRVSTLAGLISDPLSSPDGWYDNIETLQESHGLMEVFGTPDNPGGYWPYQKSDGNGLTGKLRDSSAALYSSPYGGFVWVAMFTSRSAWVQGRIYPAVPTS